MVSFQGAVLADKRGAATLEFLKVSPGNSRTVAMYVAITAAFTVQNVLATFEGVTTQVTGSGSLLCLWHLLELLAISNVRLLILLHNQAKHSVESSAGKLPACADT